MTRQEFLDKLIEIQDIFKWEIETTKYIRGWNSGYCFCPITAVCYAEHLVYIEPDRVDIAWRKYLHLSSGDAEEIIRAADASHTWHGGKYDLKLREQLETILGLE